MDVATLVRTSRRRAGLSQRELAARARTSAAAVCQYERGDRVPRVDTLQRLMAAAGSTLALGAQPAPPFDLAAKGRDLEAVLGLADALPKTQERSLTYPPMHALLARG
jgi:transcriptional regulator with XRE-family HTH domain